MVNGTKSNSIVERFISNNVELKFIEDGSIRGEFSGYASIFGNVDANGDAIQRGAFKASIKDWKSRGKLPPMLLQHGGFFMTDQDGVPVGKWIHMEEDNRGLFVHGRLINLDTDKGRGLYGALKEGVLDGISIGYRTKEFRVGTKPGEPRRTLIKVELAEISIVTFPANEQALITDVKQSSTASEMLAAEEVRELEGLLGDRGLSRKDRMTAISVFKNWRQRDAGAPESKPCDTAGTGFADIKAAVEVLTDRMWGEAFRSSAAIQGPASGVRAANFRSRYEQQYRNHGSSN